MNSPPASESRIVRGFEGLLRNWLASYLHQLEIHLVSLSLDLELCRGIVSAGACGKRLLVEGDFTKLVRAFKDFSAHDLSELSQTYLNSERETLVVLGSCKS